MPILSMNIIQSSSNNSLHLTRGADAPLADELRRYASEDYFCGVRTFGQVNDDHSLS